MQIIFGTTEKHRALEYMQKSMPSYIITEETVSPILDLVKNNEIRIGDPLIYGGNCPVYPEKNYNEKTQKILMDCFMTLKKKETKNENKNRGR
jgi:hypothetical protein